MSGRRAGAVQGALCRQRSGLNGLGGTRRLNPALVLTWISIACARCRVRLKAERAQQYEQAQQYETDQQIGGIHEDSLFHPDASLVGAA